MDIDQPLSSSEKISAGGEISAVAHGSYRTPTTHGRDADVAMLGLGFSF